MIKSFETLLKIAKRKLDELGVEAVRIGQFVDQLKMQEASVMAREQTEVEAAQNDIQLAPLLPAYRMRIKWQLKQIRDQVNEAEASMLLVRERLNEAYREKSKFEQLIEQDRVRSAMARAAAEQAQLDEVAINRVGRA
jgi:flagellar export protein FliJ